MRTALWAKIQAFVGVTADGIPGNITAEAVAKKLGIDTSTPRPAPSASSGPATIDARSAANIATLTAHAQTKAREWLLKCLAAGINVKIITGLRTYKEQDALYAQGRTVPGRKVTNAPAGYSWHNFGVAWDFVVFDEDGQPQWESPLMEECGKIAESLGHEWGGRWTSPQDTPHVTVKMGCTLADARQRVKEGKWWN